MSPFVHAQEPPKVYRVHFAVASQFIIVAHFTSDSVPMKKPIQRLIIIRSVLKKVIQGWNS